MILSQNYISDRNNNIYKEKIDVDVKIPFQEDHSPFDDLQMTAAIKWINKD